MYIQYYRFYPDHRVQIFIDHAECTPNISLPSRGISLLSYLFIKCIITAGIQFWAMFEPYRISCSKALCLQDNLGAIDYLCIVAKVALLVQKEDNSYMYGKPVGHCLLLIAHWLLLIACKSKVGAQLIHFLYFQFPMLKIHNQWSSL